MCWQVTHNFHCTHFRVENKSSFIISLRIISIRNLHDTIFWENSYFLCYGTEPDSYIKDILIYIKKKKDTFIFFICVLFLFFLDHEEQDIPVNRQETQTAAFICVEGVLSMNLFLDGCETPGAGRWTAPPLAGMVCSEGSCRRAWGSGKFC